MSVSHADFSAKDFRPTYNVGAAGALERTPRHGLPRHFLARNELHHRLLRILLQQRDRRKYFPPFNRWRWISALRTCNVPQSCRELPTPAHFVTNGY